MSSTSAEQTKPAQPDELIGRVINDRFRVISVIARGGMGRVYRAEQVPLGRMVAIKTLDLRHEAGNHDPLFQQRFFLEASIASRLQHPNTVTVFDYGRTVDDLYFIAMELVEGRSLLHLIRNEGPLPHQRVIHIALQIARSLREAHRLEVIHRDLKPGNVLLTKHGDEEDFVKVLDFGLVKHIESDDEQELTKAGLFMGSPKYMSPEQIRGEERVDARADIYALGVVMYEMLSGKVPFDRENTVKVLMAHLHEPPPPLLTEGCPDTLAQLVMRCLAKDAAQRPASMDEVLRQLKSVDGVSNFTMSGQLLLSQEMQLPPLHLHEDATSGRPGNQDLRRLTQSESGVITRAGAGPLSSGAAQPSSPHWLAKAAVIAALGIAGGFLALRFSERGGSFSAQPLHDPRAAGTEPESTGQPSSLAPEESEDDRARIVVRLNSVPSGATVSADDRVLGQTPADIEWWGELAMQGRQVTFVFRKEGFDTVTVVRELHGERLDLEVELPVARPVQPQRHHHRRVRENEASGGSEAPAPAVHSFKDDPY